MVSRLGPGTEFDLIRRFLHDAPTADLPVGPGDDAAVLDDGTVVTVDMAVEDVHFRRAWLAPEAIGYRTAAAALSDLAAMAAEPVAVLASVAFPTSDVPDVATAVMGGLREAVEAAGAVLAGGDVSRSPGGMVLDIVALGRCDAPVLRSGAAPGMELWVTGTLGGAAAAVEALTRGAEPHPGARALFERPAPRIREASWLARHVGPAAMIDLSDGLVGDAGHVAAASGVRLEIEAPALPLDEALEGRLQEDALRLALGGGEDYELLFAARAGVVGAEAAAFVETFGVALTRIGSVAAGEGVVVQGEDGLLDVTGFRHFGPGGP